MIELNNILNILINSFLEQHLSKNEKDLVTLLLSDRPSQKSVNEVFENIDIENLSDNKILFINYFLRQNPDIICPKLYIQRLTEVKNFYIHRWLELLVHYSKISQEFNKKNVAPMLLKGALLCYLNPNLLRTMGDIDILVPSKIYNYSESIAKKLNYEYERFK